MGAAFQANRRAGQGGDKSAFVELTLVADTSALADGDVIGAAVEIPAALLPQGEAKLNSVIVYDADDQKIAMDLVFMNAAQDLGTANAAPDVSDAEALDIIGTLRVATSDYIDLGGVSIGTLRNVGLELGGQSGTSLWVQCVTRGGTPTYTASGLRLRLGFEQH